MPLYQYTVQLNDKLSNPMQSMAASGVGAYGKMQKGQSTLNDSVKRGAQDVSGYSNGIGRLKTMVGGFLGLQLGKTILGWGSDMQQTRISFQTLTGSVADGNKLFDDINKFANVTPLNNAELQKNATTMLAFGIGLKDIMPNLQMLGDVAMGDGNKLQSLTLAFSQIQSTGRLMGQDLNQLINAGFNPLTIISKQTGKSMADLKEEMEQGGISAAMVSDAFKIATSEGGMFYEMMKKQSESMGGKWSTLMGKIQFKIGGFVESNNAFWGGLLDKIMQVGSWVSQNADILGAFFGVIGVALLGYQAYLKGVALWHGIVALTNPWTITVMALAALAAGVVWAWNKFEKFRGVVMGTYETLKAFAGIIQDFVIARFNSLLSGLGAMGSAISALFNGEFGKAKDFAIKGMRDLAGVDAQKAAFEAAKGLGSKYAEGYQKGVNGKAGDLSMGGIIGDDPANKEKEKGIGESKIIKNGLDGIAGGGTRSTNVNINIGNLIESFSVNSATVNEGIDDMRDKVIETLLRAVNSSNRLSYQQ